MGNRDYMKGYNDAREGETSDYASKNVPIVGPIVHGLTTFGNDVKKAENYEKGYSDGKKDRR